MNQITKNIFLGDWGSSVNPQLLYQNNIKYVLGINTQMKSQNELKNYRQMDITNMHIKEFDIPETNLYRYFDKTNKFIHNAVLDNKNILVHCTMGISRSTTIIIAYLLWSYYIYDKRVNKHGLTQAEVGIYKKQYKLKDIIKYIQYRRPQINPNIGFIKQLNAYEKTLIEYLIKQKNKIKCIII